MKKATPKAMKATPKAAPKAMKAMEKRRRKEKRKLVKELKKRKKLVKELEELEELVKEVKELEEEKEELKAELEQEKYERKDLQKALEVTEAKLAVAEAKLKVDELKAKLETEETEKDYFNLLRELKKKNAELETERLNRHILVATAVEKRMSGIFTPPIFSNQAEGSARGLDASTPSTPSDASYIGYRKHKPKATEATLSSAGWHLQHTQLLEKVKTTAAEMQSAYDQWQLARDQLAAFTNAQAASGLARTLQLVP